MNARKLRLESLEERTLLAVMAGGIEQAAIIAPTGEQTWIVNTLEDSWDWTADDDIVSLREAIDRSADGDTIIFDESLASGTIVLFDRLEISKGITVDADGVGGITIDGNQKWTCFAISAVQTETPVELIGLTITNGKFGHGGGIDFFGGTLNLTNCTITKNYANDNGGGIYQTGTGTTLTITDCTISDNNAANGGGIYNDGGTLTLTGSTVSGNTANYGGGGIENYYNGGTLTLIGCTVSGNTISGKSGSGGGISNFSTLILTNSTVSENTAHSGGGIDNRGTLTLTNCTVSGNTSSGNSSNGGGIYNRGPLTLINSTISGNSADSGGGIEHNFSTVTLINSTVSGNTANHFGGGISSGSSLILTNSTIYGNTANDGGGIYNGGPLTITNCTVSGNTADSGGGIFNFNNSTLTLTNSIVSLNSAKHDFNISHTTPIFGSNNIIGLDPGFIVAPVFESGKLINADELDLSLTAGSIAIDSGTNAIVKTETDIAGNPRVFAAWRETATVDIGAYEYQAPVERGEIETPSSIVTTTFDIVDETDGLISLREAILYASAGETVTFDPSLSSRTITLGGAELTIDKDLTIDATDIGGVIIDVNAQSRVFFIGNDTDTISVILTRLTILNGCSDYGGGIYNYNSTLILTGSTISRNTVKYSGGGICNNGTLTFANSTVAENTVNQSGGGIYNNGMLTLTNSTVFGNTASSDDGGSGGGIYNVYNGTLALTDSTVSGNTAKFTGGGICNDSMLTFTNSTVSGNAAYFGGGIWNTGTLTLTNCTISGNTTSGYYGGGGGIFNVFSGTLTLTNSTVSGNTSKDSGGGIDNDGTLTLYNSTVSGNTAYCGGGIDNGGTLTLYNTIIAQNIAVIPRNDIYSDSNNTTINAYNTLSSYTDWTKTENCIVYDPSIPLFTDALHGDFTPAEHSQAVNTGNNDYVETETDLAGNPRIYGATVDIGAYEYQGTPSPIPTEQLAVPTIITGNRGVYVSYGANRHQITWTAVENASGYELAYTTDGINWSSAWVGGTSGTVGNLTYGSDVTYRVRALGEGPYIYSDWSETKTFRVCPMDVNNDGDISGTDRLLLSSAWLKFFTDEGYQFCADIDGNGDISNADRLYLSKNWLANIDADNLVYPGPLAAAIANTVFTEYASADLADDLDIF